jgi:hypothetical protein
LSWKVGEISLKSASKIDEFATQFNQYNLKLENQVKGFDPQQYFMNHMVSVGFSASYINTCIYGEEENDDNNSEEVLVGDLETIISTNEAHRQHRRVINERSTKSQSSSQRSEHTQEKSPNCYARETKFLN